MVKQYKNILVIKMSALGDIVHALPSLDALRKHYPNARITWLVEPQFAEVLPGEPYNDATIIFEKNALKKMSFFAKLKYLYAFRKRLKQCHFDLVIDLQGLAKSALVAFLSGCKNRIGYAEMREGSSLLIHPIIGPHKNDHVVERYLDVIRYLGAEVQQVNFPIASALYEKEDVLSLLKDKKILDSYVVLFPGAGWVTKEWAPENFAYLSERLSRSGFSVVIAGGEAEKEKGDAIVALANVSNVVNIAGNTRIKDLFCLLKNAALCVGGDTGPLHIAAAVGTPTVSLFGPSNLERSKPYGSKNIAIKTTAFCAPCYKRKCPKTFICMDLIEVSSVFEACHKFLEN